MLPKQPFISRDGEKITPTKKKKKILLSCQVFELETCHERLKTVLMAVTLIITMDHLSMHCTLFYNTQLYMLLNGSTDQFKNIQKPSEYRTSPVSNGPNLSCSQMVRFSNGPFETQPKMSSFQSVWVHRQQNAIRKPDTKKSGFRMNPVFRCPVFECLLYRKSVRHFLVKIHNIQALIF